MSLFVATPLKRQEIDRAYPLVQIVVPAVDQRRWRDYAQAYLRRPTERGILAARNAEGCICGLANFRREVELEATPVLVSDRLMFLDIVSPGAVAAALMRALEDLAMTTGCQRLVTLFDIFPDKVASLEEALPAFPVAERSAEARPRVLS